MARQRFTYGRTPKAAILRALKQELGDKPYAMRLSMVDEALVARLVNQGIDAHLEGVTNLEQTRDGYGRLHLKFGHDSLCVLLRRLTEAPDEDAPGLRGSILLTIGIEEV